MIQVYFSAHLTGSSRLTVTLIKHVFQHLLVLLHKPSSAVIAKNAQEHILVVGEMSHILDEINVSVLRALTRCIFRPTPHDDFTHFVQNTVGLFKTPTLGASNSVWQTLFQSLEQSLALPV
jgi:hypothetical protein